MSIRTRDLMPMFTARNGHGALVHYQDIWQRKNLLVVTVPEDDSAAARYAESLSALEPTLASQDVAFIVTTTPIEDLRSPAVVVADRWGEIYYVKEGGPVAELPTPDELIEWLQYVQNECPECQGETR
jgi:hypothetical protein